MKVDTLTLALPALIERAGHHKAVEYVDAYLDVAGIAGEKK